MDKIDEKILLALIKNARQTTTQIAKQVRVSRDVVRYRMAQLEKQGIIRDYVTNIDTEKLGHISALLFVSIKAEAEKEFIDYINRLDHISWAGTQMGFWSLGMAIYGKNTHEVNERFQSLLTKYQNDITNHKFAFYKSTQFFIEKYFGAKRVAEIKKTPQQYKVDKYDLIILSLLAKNARMSAVELATKVPLTPVAIAQRISKLEKSHYIMGYSIYVNVFKMGLFLFIFFIQNRKLEQRKKLFRYLQEHQRVSLLLDYVGDPFIEFGVFVKNPYETRAVLQEIKGVFPDNKVTDFFLSQEDFISFGAPPCVFE